MNNILDIAKKLISIPSTSDNPDALDKVLEVCQKELEGFNLKEYKKDGIRSVLYYNTESLPKEFKIILNAHLDIVPAKISHYTPLKKDGKLYGRGAYDMKAATAAIIVLFKELANKVNYPLGLQLVTDEEVGGFNGTKYQVEQGVKTDFVIAGENTNLEINHESKGIIWLKITTAGVSAHGAHPWHGENAIWKMQKCLNNLEKLYPIPKKSTWCTTVNLSRIETNNTALNKVPDECVAFLDIRYIPGEQKAVLDNLKKHLGKEASLEVLASESAHLTERSNLYLKKLINSTKQILGKEKNLVSHHGASDIRHYNRVAIEGICFGPIGAGHHSDNEWVNIKSIEDYYNILKHFLEHLD